MAILCEFCPCVEKASIDEAYLDLTDCLQSMNNRVEWEKVKNTFVVGYSSDSEGNFVFFLLVSCLSSLNTLFRLKKKIEFCLK